MFRSFNFDFPELCEVDRDTIFGWRKQGVEIQEKCSREIKVKLEEFVSKDGILNGEKLQEIWFPSIEADVFISHSHADLDLALVLAGGLNKMFNLKCFVDSFVWGHSEDLLRIIDKEFCWRPDTNDYDYNQRNGSTSHVYMMLATALGKIIDKSECVIFINSRNSITPRDSVSKTKSPWIFFELAILNWMRKSYPKRLSVVEAANSRSIQAKEASEKKLEVEHTVDITHLQIIDRNILGDWITLFDKNYPQHALDVLYEILPEQN